MLNTSLFSLFLITSALTVATPGPGVLMTLTSSIRYGLRTAVYVILGTATGTVVMAAISSTGLGILIATSPAAYEVIKGLGALYMVYLGVRLFRAKPFSFDLAVTVTYFCIVFVIHCGYGWIASNFRRLLSTPKAAKVINCVGGAFFLFLAARVFYDMVLELSV